MNDIQILFPVTSLKAGDYHPAEFQPVGLLVAVNVPLDDKFIANCEMMKSFTKEASQSPEEFTPDTIINPILTVDGLRWCYNRLRSAFVNEPAATSGSSSDDETDDWN